MTSRSWIFVINNPVEGDFAAVKSVPAQRIIAGEEVGESGTPHIQGAIIFSRAHRVTAACKMLGGRAHLEKMRGKWSDQDYCAKEGKVIRQEDNTNQGQRTDLEEFALAIKKGASDQELYEEFTGPMARYPKFVGGYRRSIVETKFARQFRKVTVEVYLGVGGTGKSKAAIYEDGMMKKSLFIVPDSDNLKWWDGYQGEDIIVLDDFRGSTLRYQKWLRLMDGHPMKLETKGGWTWAGWTKVIITTNQHPDEWWSGHTMQETAFGRRISLVKEF